MTLDEKWQHEYMKRRYMKHLSKEELEQRTKDVFLNFMFIDPKGRISVHPSKQEAIYWMKLWGDVCMEFHLRYGPFPAGFTNGFIKKTPYPDPRKPEAKTAAKIGELIKAKNLKFGSYLFKFGKKKYIESTLKHGQIRISPAAFYDDPSLNTAIKDKELELQIQPVPGELDLEHLRANWQKEIVDTDGRNVTFKANTNYYVYCLAAQLSPRLFLDFDADSCLLIVQPKKFIDRILAALPEKLKDWQYFAQPVIYSDPLNSRIFNVFVCKHFRYSYQKEFRMFWLSLSPVNDLEHIYLEIGNLEDCCELYSLEAVDDSE